MYGRWWLCLLVFVGCRCPSAVMPVEPAEVVASPMRLELGPIYVGQRARGTVEVSNLGSATAEVDVAIAAPFSTPVEHLTLVRGESSTVEVIFAPSTAGQAMSTLTLGSLALEVVGRALEIPECTASNVCATSQFDLTGAQCVEARREDGASCETECVIGGCASGTCVGQLKGCDDHDACTLDGCAEGAGCSHAPRTCPPATAPCMVATCDSLTGCGVEPVDDGTLCGPDECTAIEVDVCITGRCVRRPRSATARCVNRWVSLNLPSRGGASMAFDTVHQRVVLFGGSTGTDMHFDTWEWNGTAWAERIPANSPSARDGHSMVWDSERQRLVLYGGRSWFPSVLNTDLWEWDGTTWLQRPTTTAPPPRDGQNMVYDVARRRLVLFGGRGLISPSRLDDTWEFDGTSWTERTLAMAPNPRFAHSMAYDPVRQRVVLFGGADASNTLLNDTWEFDGTSWQLMQPTTLPPPMGGCQPGYDARHQRMVMLNSGETWEWDGVNWSKATPATSPPNRRGYAIAWDALRERIVLASGLVNGNIRLADTWEWDGTTWAEVDRAPHPPPRNDFAMAYDAAARRLVLFGAENLFIGNGVAETWAWNTDWGQLSPSLSPPPRAEHALVYDSVRQRVVLFGGRDSNGDMNDTWEWDGTSWLERAPRDSPPLQRGHAMAYDPSRQRVVLFGKQGTWEWDGAEWARPSPAASPEARENHAMAYDPVRQRVVLFGGTGSVYNNDTWEWDGVTWTQRVTAIAPSARKLHAMAWDTSRQRLVLFGGELSTPYLDDTWEWDGTAWTQRMPVTSPPRSTNHSMAFHEGLGRIVVLTGADTWLFYP